jgi:serine phosphatase RsbU (regulator of sigma subunit)
MSVRFRLIIGIPLFALMFFYLCLRVYLGGVAPQEYSRRGWNAERRDGRAVIADVGPNSPATGVVREGDVVIAFWSERPDATPLVTPDYWRVPPGTRYKLTVIREGQSLELPLHTTRISAGGPPGVLFAFFMLTFLLFIITGVVVFLLKPGDEQAWLLSLMLTTPVALFPLNDYIQLPRWVYLAHFLTQTLATIFFPVILRFFLIFPERSPLLRRFPKLEWLIYLPYLLFLAPLDIVGKVLTAFQLAPAWRGPFMLSAGNFIQGLVVAYMLAALIAMAFNYRAAGAASRRKLRVAMVGSGVGFLNVLLMPFGYLVGLNNAFPTLWRWFDAGLLFTMPLIPLSFAYAIVRHRVIPISLIIRRGARYLLVSRGSVVLGVVIVGLILTALLSTIFNRLQPPPIVNGMVSAVVGVIAYNLFRSLHRRYLAPVIDRRFFRQSYDTRQIIADLTESLRATTNLAHLLELVATKIQAALQTANVTIFLRDAATGDFLSAYSCDYVEADGSVNSRERQTPLPYYAEIVKQVSDNGKPLDVEQYINAAQRASDNGYPLAVDQSGLPTNPTSPINPDIAALIEVKSSLLLPLSLKGEMLGIISLGPRLGDLPYLREDEQLLMSIAGPAALAIENALLVEQMVIEAGLRRELEAENELRAMELEEARKLQLSMLPQAAPQLPHLEIAAYMKPAAEVGGDYYDFHLSDDGVLTVAIGDATGHGLKAGTVVTATKSLFNHLAQESDIPGIFERLSRALKRMNLRSLFMAMTIAKLKGNQLAIGSAGMPPVLVYRAAQRVVEEISLQGVPLGSLRNYSYRERSLILAPGDVVILMSDGFPERFNDGNEMLGYGSAKSVLSETAILQPQEIIEIFVKVADKWAGGRPLDDDMTFVVLKDKHDRAP